jgi:biopolymer transport protein ExbD
MAGNRGSRRRRRAGAAPELNLMPLMNILIVLIPMLLLSAVFIEIRSIELSPSSGIGATPASAEEPLDLALRIDESEYVLEGNGVPSRVVPRPAAGAGSLPDDPSSARLGELLAEIAAAHPNTHNIRIVVEAHTRFEEIVALMDVARGAGFPEAALEGTEPGA